MSPTGADYIRQVKQQIDEIDPSEVHGLLNDSVAIVQHALTGHVTGYPLLMRDETLATELQAHIGRSGPDAAAYR